MKFEMTEFELFNEVQKTYKGFLTIEKALLLFDMDNGYTPKIIKDTETFAIDQSIIDKINTLNGNDHCTITAMIYMKNLQESGAVNMIVGPVRNTIQTALLVDKNEAATIHKAYMNHYTELYHPEDLI